MKRGAAVLMLATLGIGMTTVSVLQSFRRQAPAPSEWRSFVASWSATGRRHTLPTETGRPAAIVQLSGAVVLAARADGLSTGFQGEAITFDDAARLSAGRAVWTDRNGDQVFSVLKGERLASRHRIVGTITGGTGAYAGIVGEYELTWQYVIETESGDVQGRATDLKGRFRIGGGAP
jgi:hypothetical protein